MINRIDEHIEFHKTILEAIDEKGAFHKAHDRHKSDVAFLEAVKSHMNELYATIGELEIKLQSTLLDCTPES